MPEGDTIFRTAARLAQAIEGRELEGIELPRWPGRLPQPGEIVTSVDALGKHLAVGFSGGLLLETHMKMTGGWHLYRPGDRWQRARSRMRARLAVSDWEAVCFDAPIVRLTTPDRLRRDLHHLGPDLTVGVGGGDVAECVRRMETLVDPSTALAEVLLDQRICCGVGNVFKSEVCWALRRNPLTPIGELDPAARHQLVQTASEQLRSNLERSNRVTVAGGLAVYGRAGEPCRRCDGTITSARTGRHARATFWCPACQLGRNGG